MTLAARTFAMIGPLGVGILTARVLGPEDRGRYFFIISVSLIAVQLAGLGLHASNSYLVATRRHLLGRLVVNSLVVAALIGPLATLLVVGVALAPELLGRVGVNRTGSTALMALLIAPLSLSVLYLTNIAVGVGRVRLFNGLTLLSSVLALLGAVVATVVGGGLLAYLVAATTAVALTAGTGLVLLLRGNPTELAFDVELFREGIAYALRAYLAGLFCFLQLRVGVIALQYNATFDDLGQFSIAAQITDALVIVPSTVSLLLFPSLVRTHSDGRWQATQMTLKRVGLFMLALSALLAAIVPYVIPLIFGRAYDGAIWLTIALLPSVLLVSLQSVLSQFIAAEGFPWGQVRAWVIGFLLAAILSFALTGHYAGYGVVTGLIVSNLVVFLLLLRETRIIQARRSSDGAAT
jgi:O-antigen/teichoic acid export membrane protein